MFKVFAYVASGIVIGAGVFGFLAPRLMAETNTSNPSPQQNVAPYQAMTQFMNSPQGQEMYAECQSRMQQWSSSQTGK